MSLGVRLILLICLVVIERLLTKYNLSFLRPSLRPGFVQSAKTNVEMVKKSKERAIVSYRGTKRKLNFKSQ